MKKSKLPKAAQRKLAVARSAIILGLRIVAIRPKSKAPDIRYCRKGADDAVDDTKVVRTWLIDDPTINLAAVTKGTPILVVDVDGQEGEAALKRFGPFPQTRETKTRNGRHLYFRHDGRITGSKISFEPKLDIIASGYTLLPESVHPDGGNYHSDDFDAPIAKLPGRMINAILARRKVPKAKSNRSVAIKAGQRDNKLTSLAGSFRRQGFDPDVIFTALRAVNIDHCHPPLPEKDIDKIVRSITRYNPADDDLFESMANVTPREVDFMWDPYFVRGAINLLEGDPNVGKTYLLCEIAAAVSSGRKLPGQKTSKPSNVLFMSAEDDPETTLVRRLIRMNADLSRITFSKKFFRLEEEALGWIETHITEQKASVLILDPLLAYMQGGIDMNKANETRPFMARLAELAKATNVTVIALRHLNKSEKDKAIFRGLGSIDITASARSAVIIGQHPDNEDWRAMVHIKHNLSERGATLLYGLADGDRVKKIVPKVEWMGECDLGPDDFLKSVAKAGRPNTEFQDAKLFLQRCLSNGPVKVKNIRSQGESRSLSYSTLKRARDEMGIEKEGQKWKLAKTSL